MANEPSAKDIAKNLFHPENFRPFLKLLPLAALGGLCGGLISTALRRESRAALEGAEPAGPLLPDPFGFVAGALLFAALAWWLSRGALFEGFRRAYLLLKGRFEKRGFSQGSLRGGLRLSDYEDEFASLADKFSNQVLSDRKEVEKYKEALSKYTDSSLSRSLKNESSFEKVGTKKVSMAVFFTDIRGFTPMSEKLTTEQLVGILNDYFSIAAEAVHRHNGRINKFIGDAVMAVFEDPPEFRTGSQACRNAVSAGLELVQKYRARTRQWHERIGTAFETDLGCGVNYGPVIFGNMGSPERMEYTAIGDAVNFASRLCSKAAGGQVRISEDTFSLVQGYFEMTQEAPITVKGKSGEFKTWLVSGLKTGYNI